MGTPALLLQKFEVTNIDHLKVDAEGYDEQIIVAFARHMSLHDGFRPRMIQWERSSLWQVNGVDGCQGSSRAAIEELGYICDCNHWSSDICCALSRDALDELLSQIRRNTWEAEWGDPTIAPAYDGNV